MLQNIKGKKPSHENFETKTLVVGVGTGVLNGLSMYWILNNELHSIFVIDKFSSFLVAKSV